MPAPVLTYDDVNVTTTNPDGTITTNPINGSTTNTSVTGVDNFVEYALNITSNIAGATIFVNGEGLGKTTPFVYRIPKQRLLLENLNITISKTGYTNVEKYVVSITNPNDSVFIQNSNFEQPLGLNNAGISIKYYINNQLQSDVDTSPSNFKSLEFSRLYKQTKSEPTPLLNLTTELSGPESSVKLTKNGISQVFPKSGQNIYSDVSNTTFFIESRSTDLFLIKRITLDEGQSTEKVYEANPNESLSLNLTLNKNSTLRIESESVRKNPRLNPIVSLYKIPNALEYNINSESGIPLTFRKNKDVTAITIIVGDDILEFDDLGEGDIFGVKIPHRVFNNIGKYNIKIYPFSFDDYEDIFNPQQPVVEERVVKETQIKKQPVIEEVVTPPSPPPPYNPYAPKVQRGSGGTSIIGDDFLVDNINPFTNRGDFVNRPVDNVNVQ